MEHPESPRLTFAPPTLADFDEFRAMWGDPKVVTWFGGKPFGEEECWQRLTRYAGMWSLLGYSFWMLRDRSTGAYVGDIGLFEGRRTDVGGFDGDPEIGWALAARWHGQGLAGEALGAALAWGRPRFKRVVAMIHPENLPSIRVAQRGGFARFGESRYKDAPTTLWEHRFGETA